MGMTGRQLLWRVEIRDVVAPPPRSQAPARPESREPALPAYSTRRPQAPQITTTAHAGSRDAQMSLPVRERITFPSNIDTDWDTPAFQRRQSG